MATTINNMARKGAVVCLLLFSLTALAQNQTGFFAHNINATAAITPLAATDVNWNNLVNSAGSTRNLTLATKKPDTIVYGALVAGKNAIKFNDSVSFIGKSSEWASPSGDYTFEFRFKRQTAFNGQQQAVFGRWTSGSFVFLCYFETTNKLTYLHNSGNTALSSSIAITDSNTHTAAITRSGTTMRMFIDGALVNTQTNASAMIAGTSSLPFRIGGYDDRSTNNRIVPLAFRGYIGDFRYSNIARYTAAYTPSTSYLTSDANTLALLPMDQLTGHYLGTPVFKTNVLARTGFSQATGGWANPDGSQLTLDGRYFFSVSAYSNALGKWTVYAAIANNLYNQYTVQSTAIQTPSAAEGTLAGNGSIVPFLGKYYHFYADGNNDIRVSFGNTLNEAFPTGTIIFTHGVGGYAAYKDPWVRLKDDGVTLEMFMVGNSGNITFLYSTSTDGTTWTAPVAIRSGNFPGYTNAPGEPSAVKLGDRYVITSDGDSGSGATYNGRKVMLWIWVQNDLSTPVRILYSAPGGGYISSYDSSPTYDAANRRIIFFSTNSFNTQPVQPTDSEIGMWWVPIESF